MAAIKLGPSAFPAGSSVAIYPYINRSPEGGAPFGNAVASGVVDATGVLTVTDPGLVDNIG